ncbi:N-acetylgalactosamine kinase-like protein [Dinothrombium tinctorium]|uniref:N-acetylgalactosamine kinase-like protein n=1 Tax=Dinothrombium tinctorium TaxID=1965070 RepID=A0A3S3PMT9_9ACAR|nr:N-acetylgalactosamine kinase-like protein [Dinothrombium tinctorium]
MASKHVPVNYCCEDKYLKDRLLKLGEHFKRKLSTSPSLYVRVPGRVNLIGEHIDYHGFAVLPMAIEHDILIAISVSDDSKINLVNLDSEKYSDFSDFSDKFAIDTPPMWYHYFLCGFRGIVENLKDCNQFQNGQSKNCLNLLGVNVAVAGTIPPSAGLSSSSALVCASALATMCIIGQDNNCLPPIDKSAIAEISTKAERYIGTQGGGMDQAIAFLAEEGCAQLIEFEPFLKSTVVTLPLGAVFYIIHCGKTLNKAATHHYNTRVFETRVAAAIIGKKYNLLSGDTAMKKKHLSLRDVLFVSGKNLDQMSTCLKDYLKFENYTLDDILEELCMTEEQMLDVISGYSKSVAQKFKDVIVSSNNKYRLFNRALHVYEEASRVLKVKKICEAAADSEEKLRTIAKLMTESHKSCKDLYECSCEELDHTVEIAVKAGALGARLTGAGWGGCVVALVRENDVVQFEQNIGQHSKVFFRSKPSQGAAVYKF